MGALVRWTSDAKRRTRHPARQGRPLTLVVDASVVVPACLAGRWSTRLRTENLVAPTLLWSEVAAALRQLQWRQDIDASMVRGALAWLATTGIEPYASAEILSDAWRIASRLGWAKTYDAEYVALAQNLALPLVTLDARLKAATSGLITFVDPADA